MLSIKPSNVDYLEAGQGPLVILVHPSVSGARQWRKLIDVLADSFHLKAVNAFGYARTPAWTASRPQILADQAALIEAIVPDGIKNIALVGHSFGGSVAMRASAKLGERVTRLALLEPNPFNLLRDSGRNEAFAEIAKLRDIIKAHGAKSSWSVAAQPACFRVFAKPR
jgi:pimeloyl-ACP methyl ester carboxylesterase